MEPRDRFAVNLRKARHSKQISQEELGFRCELHRTEISLLERGGREPRLGTIPEIYVQEIAAPGREAEEAAPVYSGRKLSRIPRPVSPRPTIEPPPSNSERA